jgi:hypothetical protein
VRLSPDAASWPALLDDRLGTRSPLHDRASRFRAQLGLPAHGPIVASGHQAQAWHPGIFTKLVAASALAARGGARPGGASATVAWLIVDQDVADPFSIDLPVIDARGRLRVRRWNPDARAGDASGTVPALARRTLARAARPAVPAGWAVAPQIAARAEAWASALDAHAGAADGVEQSTRALLDVLGPALGGLGAGRPPHVVRAGVIARTELFASVLERARARPQTLFDAYNAAVSGVPGSGVRPLAPGVAGRDGLEMPFWVIDRLGARRAACEADLALPGAALVPRGLLATGLVRLAGCEVFIHGTGGGAYEPINDLWLGGWLDGDAHGRALAPFVTATADLFLDLPGSGVTQADAARARWEAHHARHHPRLVGDTDAQRERDQTVTQLAAARSEDRARLFAGLAALRAQHERRHAGELAALRGKADDAAARAAGEGVRAKRDFSVVLHDARDLIALRRRVEAALGVAAHGASPTDAADPTRGRGEAAER